MENKFSAKALMLCPICKNSYYSKLEVTVPDNFKDMKEINTARDNNGDIVHLDICSSAAPIKKEPCCPKCGQPFPEFLRGQVQSSWRKLFGMKYCAVICHKCKEVIGWEKP